ncbi:MAG: carbohydrate kinase family protein [Deferribacterales bacterium]
MSREKYRAIIIFGEVLFDIFDGVSRIGGAPFNVCWHLHNFGLKTTFVTAVGKDSLGDSVLRLMNSAGMDMSHVSVADRAQTGRVEVVMDGRSHSFVIHDNQAYDAISPFSVPDGDFLFYHGSLALRHRNNMDIVNRAKQAEGCRTFCDINLRDIWRSEDFISEVLNGVRWLKINDEELNHISPMYGLTGGNEQRCLDLAERLSLDTVFLTKGESGAEAHSKEISCVHESISVPDFKDTVGAGDAMAAVCMLGLTLGWDSYKMISRGAEFASIICGQRGALPDSPEVYKKLIKRWEL